MNCILQMSFKFGQGGGDQQTRKICGRHIRKLPKVGCTLGMQAGGGGGE